jgi:rubrerythrin
MTDGERINTLDVAIGNEMRERAFYLSHAKRTRNLIGRAMFEQLADEELEHAARLREVHAKWQEHGKWPETVPLRVKDTIIRDILLNAVKNAEAAPEGNADDLEAIRTAIGFEEQGVRIYAELADAVSDANEKAFFSLLSMIEHEHYQSLLDAEEYFAEPVSWLSKTEHRTFDKE